MTYDACAVCAKPRADWPLIFRGDDCCSVNCAKALDTETCTACYTGEPDDPHTCPDHEGRP